MIVEEALFTIDATFSAAFEASLREALPLLEVSAGCHGAEVRRQVENPAIYELRVQWDDLDAHEGFRASERFERWRDLTRPHLVAPAEVVHFGPDLER